MKLTDLAWLAGLLEGEGCFRTAKPSTPIIKLTMTDEDVVTRAADLLGSHAPRAYAGPAQYKQAYETRVYGKQAAAWMMTLFPLLGVRRQAKVREVLACWRAAPGSGCHASRTTREAWTRRKAAHAA